MADFTHREVKNPQISARDLADYMAAGTRERAKRTIIRNSKYRSLARIVQHDDAKMIISKFFLSENQEVSDLEEKAEWVRNKIADSQFEEDVNAHNADYIKRFAKVFEEMSLPKFQLAPPGQVPPLTLGGVRVTTELCFRLRRLTKTNKIRIGGAALRYAKGKALDPLSGEWQAGYLHGYLSQVKHEDAAQAERSLCIVIDAYSGVAYAAPSDSVTRFNEMEAACATIAERWAKVEPPRRGGH